ncbi:MAG: hypothetical protein HP491_01150 [Nitrospira sp.]|nr:hypothetical protein [Nitrospira sp.]MBH0182238.1 hypothetical protein [Nitrospira sp.]MBH0183839.1 hypothetical protein [Nitrospira sp.]
MKQLQAALLCICVASVAVAGCRGGAEIYTVKDAPVITASGKTPSLEEMQKAIVTAGVGLNWSMAVVKPGHIVGTLNVRSHQAVVDIVYNSKTYSITYKDSTNMKYNAEKKLIHENYRGWIQNLDNNIRNRMTVADK